MFNKNLYTDLVSLVQKHDAFFFKDFQLEDKIYRIFDYQLAGWMAFQEPSALNARGIMFNITDKEDIKLVSLPPEKFFNYEEGTIDHSKSSFGDKMVKMDGSLISTFLHNDTLYLKSKGSLFSNHAVNAMKVLDAHPPLKKEVEALVKNGFTINFEYTSPEYKIVVPYQKEDLTILSMRSHKTGKIYFANKMMEMLKEAKYTEMLKIMVYHESLHGKNIRHDYYLNEVRNEQHGEGYVQELIDKDGNSYLVKIKNFKYISLHHVKDSLNSAKNLFNVIIDGGSDDLRAIYINDKYSMNKITTMENHVQDIYNKMIKQVENFYEENKHLDKKNYAMKACEFPKFKSLMINKLIGRENDYKEYSKKHMTQLYEIKSEDNSVKNNHPANKKI